MFIYKIRITINSLCRIFKITTLGGYIPGGLSVYSSEARLRKLSWFLARRRCLWRVGGNGENHGSNRYRFPRHYDTIPDLELLSRRTCYRNSSFSSFLAHPCLINQLWSNCTITTVTFDIILTCAAFPSVATYLTPGNGRTAGAIPGMAQLAPGKKGISEVFGRTAGVVPYSMQYVLRQ